MKVNGPGQPPTPVVSESEVASQAGKPDKVSGTPADAGKSFAEKVSGPRAPEGAASAIPVGNSVQTPRRPGDVVVTDLAAALQAGKLTPSAAIEKVLDRIVARQIGPEAPPAVREQVRSALRDAVENDPLLAEQLRLLD